MAVAGQRLRRAPGVESARHGADVPAGAGGRLRHSLCLSGLSGGVSRAPQPADLGHAPGRRSGHRPGQSGGGVRRVQPAAARAGHAAAARGAAVLGAAVCRRRPDRRLHQRQQCAHSGALPRLHRRRHASADGCGVPHPALARLPGAAGSHGHLAALAIRHRATDAHHRTGLVRRLWRATQGGGRRAGAAQHRRSRRHGPDGTGRPDRHHRRAAVRGGRDARHPPSACRHRARLKESEE